MLKIAAVAVHSCGIGRRAVALQGAVSVFGSEVRVPATTSQVRQPLELAVVLAEAQICQSHYKKQRNLPHPHWQANKECVHHTQILDIMELITQ